MSKVVRSMTEQTTVKDVLSAVTTSRELDIFPGIDLHAVRAVSAWTSVILTVTVYIAAMDRTGSAEMVISDGSSGSVRLLVDGTIRKAIAAAQSDAGPRWL